MPGRFKGKRSKWAGYLLGRVLGKKGKQRKKKEGERDHTRRLKNL